MRVLICPGSLSSSPFADLTPALHNYSAFPRISIISSICALNPLSSSDHGGKLALRQDPAQCFPPFRCAFIIGHLLSNCATTSIFQVPYSSPVSVALYPFYSVVLIFAGFAAMSGYFVNQMKAPGSKSIVVEFLLAAIASAALGFGTFFLMLSFGLYV
jgi:hypothetical protein